MSDSQTVQPVGLERIQALIDGWTQSLAQLLDAMAGQRPQIHWRAVAGSAQDAGVGSDADRLWWGERLQFSSAGSVWVGAPRETWEHVSGLLLKAAGLETVPDGEAQKTWQEILSQWLSALARSIGSIVGQEVACLPGEENAPGADQHDWALVSLDFDGHELPPLAITISEPLLAELTKPRASAPESEAPAEAVARAAPSRTMELLLDVELPVSVSFGKTDLPLKEVLKLTTGSIVELNRGVSEPVEILVNHCLIARGEVVVVDGNYGVRIQRIVSRQDRLRTLR